MRAGFIKKVLSLIAALLFILPLSAACTKKPPDDGKIKVYASIYPVYYLSAEIGGECANVKSVLPSGGSAHGFTPTMQQNVAMADADILVLVGFDMEEWYASFKGILKKADYAVLQRQNPPDHEHGHKHKHENEHNEGFAQYYVDSGSEIQDALLICDTSLSIDSPIHGAEDHDHGHYDPHTWTSIRNMQGMAWQILQAYITKDFDNADYYRANFDRLNSQLDSLDDDFSEALLPHTGKQIIVSHRAFAYMCEDYGLNQIAVQGISNEIDPTSQKLVEIAEIIIQNQYIKVLYWESDASPQVFLSELAKIPELSDRNITIEKLSPAETLSSQRINAGDNYITVMRDNLAALLKGF